MCKRMSAYVWARILKQLKVTLMGAPSVRVGAVMELCEDRKLTLRIAHQGAVRNRNVPSVSAVEPLYGFIHFKHRWQRPGIVITASPAFILNFLAPTPEGIDVSLQKRLMKGVAFYPR